MILDHYNSEKRISIRLALILSKTHHPTTQHTAIIYFMKFVKKNDNSKFIFVLHYTLVQQYRIITIFAPHIFRTLVDKR